MKPQPVTIVMRKPWDWTILVNGTDLAPGLSSFALSADASGDLPHLALDLRLLELERLDLEQAHIVVPESTRDALIALGWTPPHGSKQ